jgi:glycosyltransferase involved in cell wall biosynthesis
VIATPSAAVIIPTHNRSELLRKVLESVLVQSVPSEVHVMDDASTDGAQAMVQRDFPQVQYHREEVSKGPTFQRNKGVELSKAPVLFTIDDDCVLTSPKTFEQALEAFDHPRVGAVTLPFVNVLQDNTVQKGFEKNGRVMVTFEYFGGMVAFRRDAFLAAGGYREYLFMHVEESDLAIRMLQNGLIVRLGWSDPIDHFESPLRNRQRLNELEARNFVLYPFFNVPWPYFPGHLCATTINSLRMGWRRGALTPFMRGLCRGYAGMLFNFFQRKPVSGRTYRLSRLLKTRHIVPLEEIEPGLPAIIHPGGQMGDARLGR